MKLFVINLIMIIMLISSISIAEESSMPKGGLGKGGMGRRHGPPKEAIEACKEKPEGEACLFESPHGTLNGTCRKLPRGDLISCVPEGHRPPPPKDEDK